MPINKGKDKRGTFVRWGKRTRYYFNPKSIKSQTIAKNKAENQARAIYSSGYTNGIY